MLSGIFTGHVLHASGGWTGYLMVAHWKELEECSASGVHINRFKSQEKQVSLLHGERDVHCANGALQPARHVVPRTLRLRLCFGSNLRFNFAALYLVGWRFRWTINMLASAVTMCTRACAKTVSQIDLLHPFHHTPSSVFVTLVMTSAIAYLYCSNTLFFTGVPEDSKSTSGGLSCFFLSERTFVPISRTC